jgi:L-ascorbate metabolism protein UlaG (beta-lactamase superfamily)
VEWYGHSCFLLTLENGHKILTDPFDTTRVPYSLPSEKVDVVLSSHDHFDHNAVEAVSADYILRASGTDSTFYGSKKGVPFEGESSVTFDLGGVVVTFSTVPSFHDERRGELRGPNGIIRFTIEGITFVHLGDLGHNLTRDQINALTPVDVLMIPVGGYYTIDAQKAKEIVSELKPRIVLPMHYKTPVLTVGFPITDVKPFTDGYSGVIHRPGSSIVLRASDLPKATTIEILKYHGQN